MSRSLRHIEPNGFYHVISRSINNEWIFKEKSDFLYFCRLEKRLKEKFPIRLYHYVLMNTHFHFVLQAIDRNKLIRHFSSLKWFYTDWVKEKYGWNGPIWRERYKSLPIENEDYLYTCGKYVEYNPVRAHMCKEPEDYQFSSYRKYALGEKNELLDEYDVPQEISEKLLLFAPEKLKSTFSKARAIGSPQFLSNWHKKRGRPREKK